MNEEAVQGIKPSQNTGVEEVINCLFFCSERICSKHMIG